MDPDFWDNLKMEILSTRPHCLTLEARHTISLEVSKQRSLRVANSLFLPRKLRNRGLLAIKQSEPSNKEPSNMNSRQQLPGKNILLNQDTTSQAVENTNSQGLGVISRFPQSLPVSTPNMEQSNGNLQSRPCSRRENVPRTPFNWNPHMNHAEEILRAPSRNMGLQGKKDHPRNLRTPPFDIQLEPIEIIEISSDEEDTKDEVKTIPPPRRYPASGENKPRTAMPRPMPSTPTQRANMSCRHRRDYPSVQPIIIPPIVYPVVHGCHQQSNHQDFYNDLYADISRQLAMYPSRMSPEGRYRSYEPSQRAGAETPNPYPDQIYDRSMVRYRPYDGYHHVRERPSHSHHPHSDYPRSLPPIDISNWMAPRYTRQRAIQDQPHYRQAPSPAQEPSNELVPFGNPLDAFYERVHEIYQAGLNHELPPPPPHPPHWLPDAAAAAAVDYAVALIRDAGNNWRRPQPQSRMPQFPARANPADLRPTQTSPSPVPQVDSTTAGDNSPPLIPSTPRSMFPQNPPAPTAPSTSHVQPMQNVQNVPNVPNVSLHDMLNNQQAPNVEIGPNNRNPFAHQHPRPTLRSMLNEPFVPPKLPTMPNPANIRNAEDIPIDQRNRQNIPNIHNLPNARVSENELNAARVQNADKQQPTPEQMARNNHALNLANFQNAHNLQYLLQMQNKNEQAAAAEQAARNKQIEQNALREQLARHRTNARNNRKNEENEKNARHEQNVPNTHNAPNLANMPTNMHNLPNFPSLQAFANFTNLQNQQHNPHAAHAQNGKHGHMPNPHNPGQMIPNIPNTATVRNGQRYQIIPNQHHSQPRPNILNSFLPRFPPPQPPPPTPNIPNNRFNPRAQPSRPASRINSSAASPAMSHMSFSENGSEDASRCKSNLPEYDPRDNR